jgi:transposase
MQESSVGIDVSKAKLDIYILPEKKFFTVSNDKKGFKQLIQVLKQRNIRLLVLEATGGYELASAYTLMEENLPVSIVNPTRIRKFAGAKNLNCKTDKVDAMLIAEFAEMMKPEPRELLSRDLRELKELIGRRTQLVDEITAEKSRLDTIISETVIKDTKAHIKQLRIRVKRIEQEIKAKIKANSQCKFLYDFFKSFTGLGEITAAALIANMPELGFLSGSEISALLGVAPYNSDSGKKSGKRFIRGGRKDLRDVFYMATLSACFHDPVIKSFYLRLLANGKAQKVAITACMRKFITIINAKLKELMIFDHFLSFTTCF